MGWVGRDLTNHLIPPPATGTTPPSSPGCPRPRPGAGDGAPTAPPGSLGRGQMLIFDRGMTEMQLCATQRLIFAHVLQDLQKFL